MTRYMEAKLINPSKCKVILKYSQVTILGAGKLKDLYTQMRRVIRRSMMMIKNK